MNTILSVTKLQAHDVVYYEIVWRRAGKVTVARTQEGSKGFWPDQIRNWVRSGGVIQDATDPEAEAKILLRETIETDPALASLMWLTGEIGERTGLTSAQIKNAYLANLANRLEDE